MIGLVWAQARGRVIGVDGAIPWRLPADQSRFKELTLGATVVMGRSTWESLPAAVRPLPGRTSVVLTRRAGWSAPGAVVAASLGEALALAPGDAWVIGGEAVYAAALPVADVLEVTEVDLDVPEAAGGAAGRVARAPALGPEWAADGPTAAWRTDPGGLRYRFTTLHRTA